MIDDLINAPHLIAQLIDLINAPRLIAQLIDLINAPHLIANDVQVLKEDQLRMTASRLIIPHCPF